MKNRWGEVPINKILPDTMEDFLNQHCLQSTKVSTINKILPDTMVDFLNQHCLQSTKVSTLKKILPPNMGPYSTNTASSQPR